MRNLKNEMDKKCLIAWLVGVLSFIFCGITVYVTEYMGYIDIPDVVQIVLIYGSVIIAIIFCIIGHSYSKLSDNVCGNCKDSFMDHLGSEIVDIKDSSLDFNQYSNEVKVKAVIKYLDTYRCPKCGNISRVYRKEEK